MARPKITQIGQKEPPPVTAQMTTINAITSDAEASRETKSRRLS